MAIVARAAVDIRSGTYAAGRRRSDVMKPLKSDG
jgi:hypothetical protein